MACKDPGHMEEPCLCPECNEWFELGDGVKRCGELICGECNDDISYLEDLEDGE